MTFKASPVVWLIHDDKPGHMSQLRGIANRLRARAQAQCHWIDGLANQPSLWRAWLGIPPALNVPDAVSQPDLIIAAGSGTHRLMAALRRQRRARTVLLMRPGFPRRWLDDMIIPAHDQPPATANTLITTGVLNTMTPLAQLTRRQHGLILIGGPSRHYRWDTQAVLEQVNALVTRYPQWYWTLSSSRRTPEDAITALEQYRGPRHVFRHHRDTHEGWLAHTLADCRAAWISPDSVSMVYEALTTGLPTGLLVLEATPGSRVASGVTQLLASDRVGTVRHPDQVMAKARLLDPPLWEADRAAAWILKRWQEVA